jgi:hypothetical protein
VRRLQICQAVVTELRADVLPGFFACASSALLPSTTRRFRLPSE